MSRETLASARTYYVRTDGNDNNNGLTNSSSGAFRTIQHSIDNIYENIDAAGNTITIQVGCGTWNESLNLRSVVGLDVDWNGNAVSIIGDTTTPSNCLLSTASANCVTAGNFCRTAWIIKGFKMTTTTSGNCVEADAGAPLYLGKNEFGSCAGLHIQALYDSFIELIDDYIISSSPTQAAGSGFHFYAARGGKIIAGKPITCTLLNTPNFTGAFAGVFQGGNIHADPITFTGSATGTRYVNDTGSFITTGGNGVNFFPGNTSGYTNPANWYS